MKMRDNNHSPEVEVKCWNRIYRNIVVTPPLEGFSFKNSFVGNQWGIGYMYVVLHQ